MEEDEEFARKRNREDGGKDLRGKCSTKPPRYEMTRCILATTSDQVVGNISLVERNGQKRRWGRY